MGTIGSLHFRQLNRAEVLQICTFFNDCVLLIDKLTNSKLLLSNNQKHLIDEFEKFTLLHVQRILHLTEPITQDTFLDFISFFQKITDSFNSSDSHTKLLVMNESIHCKLQAIQLLHDIFCYNVSHM